MRSRPTRRCAVLYATAAMAEFDAAWLAEYQRRRGATVTAGAPEDRQGELLAEDAARTAQKPLQQALDIVDASHTILVAWEPHPRPARAYAGAGAADPVQRPARAAGAPLRGVGGADEQRHRADGRRRRQ